MHGNHERKTRKRTVTRTAAVILLVIAICVSSIATVMANTVSATVIDGDQVYTFIMSSTDTDDIIAEAEMMGLEPLGKLDICERVGETTTVNVRRGVTMTVNESGIEAELVAYQGDTVQKTLEDNSIVLKVNDIVEPGRETVIEENLSVSIRRYSEVIVEADDNVHTIALTGCTVEEALASASITIGEDDTVNYPLDEPLFNGMNIKVSRIITINVVADGEKTEHKVSANSVKEAVDKLDLALGENDIISPPLTSSLEDGEDIVIQRVENKEIEETEEIPFETVEETDSSLYVGETEIRTQGVTGEKKLKYSVTYTDGEETGRELISETVTVEPVAQLTVTGTKERETPKTESNTSTNTSKPASNNQDTQEDSSDNNTVSESTENTVTDASGNVVGYSSMISGKGTAYCDSGLTASGHETGYGYVAVNPNVIPYGTKLYIRSTDGAYERYCIASDTGGALMKGNVLVDIWFPTEAECSTFGVRTVEVFFMS